jgi:hypothetical protein
LHAHVNHKIPELLSCDHPVSILVEHTKCFTDLKKTLYSRAFKLIRKL